MSESLKSFLCGAGSLLTQDFEIQSPEARFYDVTVLSEGSLLRDFGAVVGDLGTAAETKDVETQKATSKSGKESNKG